MPAPSPAPWEYENVPLREDRSAYGVVRDADGKILFDTLNSDVAEIHQDEWHRWDEQGRVNLTLAAAAPMLRKACEAALKVLPALEVRSWPPGHELKKEAIKLLQEALALSQPR